MRSSGVTPVKLEQTDAVILIVDLSRLRCVLDVSVGSVSWFLECLFPAVPSVTCCCSLPVALGWALTP